MRRLRRVALLPLPLLAMACNLGEAPTPTEPAVGAPMFVVQDVPPRNSEWVTPDAAIVWRAAAEADSTMVLGMKGPDQQRLTAPPEFFDQSRTVVEGLPGVTTMDESRRYSALLLHAESLEAVQRLLELAFLDYLEPNRRPTNPSRPDAPEGLALSSSGCWGDLLSSGPNFGAYLGPTGDSIPVIYDKMGIEGAWNYSTGVGVTVANIDTGINTSHSDLSHWTVDSYDLGDDGEDDHGHGTHAAGAFGAASNGQVIAGVAFGANHVSMSRGDQSVAFVSGWRIMIAINRSGSVHGAKVMNMPFRVHDGTELVKDAIDDWYFNEDVVFVAAAGSIGAGLPGSSDVVFPADYEQVIAVPAVDYDTDEKYHCSMEGHENELAAYHGMPTTGWASEGEWGMSSNTSNASTIMAGIVTLVRSRYPFLSNGQVRHHLRKYATDLGSAGRDDKYGYGPVRADLAVNPPDMVVFISGPSAVRTDYVCEWSAFETGGVGPTSFDWYVNGVYKESGRFLEAALTQSPTEILVRGTDAAGNEEFRAKYVDVSPSNPIGSCEEPWA